jgi:hypothetical protein
MATYFKYAERSAESQINWAEVGKNMTDMLQEQERIRDEKINALDAASREFGEKLANPPQGEHKSANQWALEYGDNASQYMLMQEKLFKSGKMKTKDYLVSRQNLIDGTKQAFNLTKEFQETYKMKMDRYKKGESQDLELFVNSQAERFGDFTKSQLYINPTDGSVNVAMKERQVIGGKEVFVMNQNPNDFTTISSLRNTIAGTYDKFDTNAVTTAFADSIGKEETATIVFGTLSKGGSITTVQDITSRTDLDADGKTVMFKFIDAENQMITAALENPYNRLSVLTNTKKFAPNGKQYAFTYDEADAKANPEKVLLKVDSTTGQPTPQFSEEQMKVSNEAMRTEVRAKYDYKKGVDPTAQAQAQYAPESVTRGRAEAAQAEAAAGYWNQLYTGKTAAEKKAAADTLLGTPIAQQAGLLAIDLTKNGKITLKYADPIKNRTIDYLDTSGNPVSLRDFSGLGVELHGVVDREKAVKAGGGGTGFGKVDDLDTVISQRQGPPPAASAPVKIPDNIFTIKSGQSAKNIKLLLPANFKVEEDTGFFGVSNDVVITAPSGDTFTYNANLTNASEIPAAKEGLQNFIKANTAAGDGVFSQFN